MAIISKAAISKGVTKRRRDAANDAARIQALAAGEVLGPTIVRRDPDAPKVEFDTAPIEPSENHSRAQACSDAKREAVRSSAIRPALDEHPQFPGRPAHWRPNRHQRAKLRRQGLL